MFLCWIEYEIWWNEDFGVDYIEFQDGGQIPQRWQIMGTSSYMNAHILRKPHAKFHAFVTFCTILPLISVTIMFQGDGITRHGWIFCLPSAWVFCMNITLTPSICRGNWGKLVIIIYDHFKLSWPIYLICTCITYVIIVLFGDYIKAWHTYIELPIKRLLGVMVEWT